MVRQNEVTHFLELRLLEFLYNMFFLILKHFFANYLFFFLNKKKLRLFFLLPTTNPNPPPQGAYIFCSMLAIAPKDFPKSPQDVAPGTRASILKRGAAFGSGTCA